MARSLSLTDIGKSYLSREFLTSQICLLPPLAKNKILAKISEFTVTMVSNSYAGMYLFKMNTGIDCNC